MHILSYPSDKIKLIASRTHVLEALSYGGVKDIGQFPSERGAERPYRRAPQGPLFRVAAPPWAAATRRREAREGDGPLRGARRQREVRAGGRNRSKKRPVPADTGDSRDEPS